MDRAGTDAGALWSQGAAASVRRREGGDRGGEAGGAESAQAEREAGGGGAFDYAVLRWGWQGQLLL